MLDQLLYFERSTTAKQAKQTFISKKNSPNNYKAQSNTVRACFERAYGGFEKFNLALGIKGNNRYLSKTILRYLLVQKLMRFFLAIRKRSRGFHKLSHEIKEFFSSSPPLPLPHPTPSLVIF